MRITVRIWASFAFLICALFIGAYQLKPSSLPAHEELFPPDINSEVRQKAQAYPNRSDIVSRYMDLQLKDTELDLSTAWWATYKKAQVLSDKNPKTACKLYKGLAYDKRFPLHGLAQVHSQKLCKSDITEPVQKLSELDEKILDAKIDVAEDKKSPLDQVEALVEKSKASVIYDEKVNLMLKAVDIAKNNNLENLTEVQTRLYRLSPSRMQKPPRSKYLDVANDLAKRRLFKKSRVYYRKVIRNSRFTMTDKIRAYKGLSRSYKLQLDRPRTLKAIKDLESYVYTKVKTRGLAKWECNVYKGVNILLARTQWTQHDAKSGRKTINKLVKNCSGKTNLALAHWILGRMAEERHHFKTAQLEYKKAKKQANSKSEFYEKILWSLAWVQYKTEAYSESLENFQELVDRKGTGLTAEKYKFWLAMTYKNLNQSEESEKNFQVIIDETPLSFYSYLSQRELGLNLKKKDVLKQLSDQEMDTPPITIAEYFDELYFEWLVSLNEKDVAKEYLNAVSQNLRASKQNENLKAWVYVFNQYSRLNSHIKIFEKLSALEEGLRQEIFHNYHHLIFPTPFNEEVSGSSARFGVRAEYIYAIMRQESAFNPNARSHMDAFGLMQLLPEVAKVTAEKHGIEFNEPNDLYNPKTSILIGTSHLRELLDQYKGNLVLAIASYNANERAIQNWMKTRYKGDTLEFIEDIPYQETSNYVKLVLRNLYTYTLFNSPEPNTEFPEWSLSMSQINN